MLAPVPGFHHYNILPVPGLQPPSLLRLDLAGLLVLSESLAGHNYSFLQSVVVVGIEVDMALVGTDLCSKGSTDMVGMLGAAQDVDRVDLIASVALMVIARHL